jgi:hypothetical protein
MRRTPRGELAPRGFVAGMVLIVRVTMNRRTGEPGSEMGRRHLLAHAPILARSRRHGAPPSVNPAQGEHRDVGQWASCEGGEPWEMMTPGDEARHNRTAVAALMASTPVTGLRAVWVGGVTVETLEPPGNDPGAAA